MLWRMRTTTKLVLGGIFAFLGVSCSAIGVGMVVAPSDPEHPASGVALLIMSAGIFIAPAVALLTIGVRSRRAARDLEQVIAMGQASARAMVRRGVFAPVTAHPAAWRSGWSPGGMPVWK